MQKLIQKISQATFMNYLYEGVMLVCGFILYFAINELICAWIPSLYQLLISALLASSLIAIIRTVVTSLARSTWMNRSRYDLIGWLWLLFMVVCLIIMMCSYSKMVSALNAVGVIFFFTLLLNYGACKHRDRAVTGITSVKRFVMSIITYSVFLLSISFILILLTNVSQAGTINTQIQAANSAEQQAIQKEGAYTKSIAQQSLQRSLAYQPIIPKGALSSAAIPEQHAPQAILFVSLGMPTKLLRQYLVAAKTYQIPLVIRGLVHNDMKQTTSRVHELLIDAKGRKIDGGFVLDPMWFRRYHISVVPTLVISTKAPVNCPANTDCAPASYDQIAGNLSMKDLLTQIANHGDQASVIASTILKQGEKRDETLTQS